MSKSIKKLSGDLSTINEIVNDPQYLKQACQYVRSAAIGLAPVRANGGGWLSQNIDLEITTEADGLAGHIGTDVKYAMYVEFGTGPKGMANHEGISPNVTPTYRSTPWLIPAEKINPKDAELYHWQKVVTERGTYYRTSGQPAQPFLYPALKDNEQAVAGYLAGGWQEAIRRKTK